LRRDEDQGCGIKCWTTPVLWVWKMWRRSPQKRVKGRNQGGERKIESLVPGSYLQVSGAR